MSTSVTLTQIWQSDAVDLQPVLQARGYRLSSNLNYDRAVVAMLYYNAGMLVDPRVANPYFLTVMVAHPTLEAGLVGLKATSFRVKLTTLNMFLNALEHGHFATTVGSAIASNIRGSYFTHYTNVLEAVGNALVITTKQASYLPDVYIRAREDTSYDISYVVSAPTTLNSPLHLNGIEAALRAHLVPGATDLDLAAAASTAAWKTLLAKEAMIRAMIARSGILYEPASDDPVGAVTVLLSANFRGVVPIARCFYLWSISELLDNLPPQPELEAKLETLVTTQGCSEIFAPVPMVTIPGLSPLLGAVGGPNKAAFTKLVGEYATTKPGRDVVIQRLLAL